jgi:Gas vesicle synthesis protein GvpL/GvpF
MIYVYAISEPRPMLQAPEQRGLGGARLRLLRCSGIAAVFSRHRTLRPRPSPETLWSHEAVVRQLMAKGAVLPLRFGTVLDGEHALRGILVERHAEFAQGLERVRGHVELGVRVLGAPARERPQGQGSGRAYLMALHAAHHRTERTARELHEPLAAMAYDARLRPPAAPPTILAAAYLVDRGRVDAFRAHVSALNAERDDVSIACTGPWPPYSFVPDQRP